MKKKKSSQTKKGEKVDHHHQREDFRGKHESEGKPADGITGREREI
jgi:hypothetical protein